MENNIYEITKLITRFEKAKPTVLNYEIYEFWTLEDDDVCEVREEE